MPSERLVGVGLVAVSAAAFGALGVLARVAYDDGADPIAVLTLRFSLAAALFGVLRLVRPRPRPTGRPLLGLIFMGGCYFLQSLCYFSAIDRASPGLVALLLYAYPAIVVVLGVAVLGLRLDRRVAAACLAAVAGTAVIVGPSASGGDPVGIAFGLGAALVYAVYILAGSQVLDRVDPLWASTVIMTTAAGGYALLYGLTDPRPAGPESADGWAAVLTLALLCTVVAGVAFLAGLDRVGPADASTISTIEPVVSVVLAAIVVGEAITGWTVAGGLLVVGSVVAISRLEPEAALEEPAPRT